jgi:hypothetical protein
MLEPGRAGRGEQLEKENWKIGGEIPLTAQATECSFCESQKESEWESIFSPCSADVNECSLYEDEEEETGWWRNWNGRRRQRKKQLCCEGSLSGNQGVRTMRKM